MVWTTGFFFPTAEVGKLTAMIILHFRIHIILIILCEEKTSISGIKAAIENV